VSDLVNTAAPLVGVIVGWLLTRGQGMPYVPAPTIASFELPTLAELTQEDE
jgi:hypothetical protein